MSRWYQLPADSYETYVLPRRADAGRNGNAEGGRFTLLRESARRRRERILSELESLHPGFTPLHAVDARRLPSGRGQDLLVTVMTAESLADARLQARGARLFIAVGGKDTVVSSRKRVECFRRPRWPWQAVSFALVLALGACGGSFFLAGESPHQAELASEGVHAREAERESGNDPSSPEPTFPFIDGAGWLALVSEKIAGSGTFLSVFDFDLNREPALDVAFRGGDPGIGLSLMEGAGLAAAGIVPVIAWNGGMAEYSQSFAVPSGAIRVERLGGLTGSLTDNARLVGQLRAAITASGGTPGASRPFSGNGGTQLEIECSVGFTGASALFAAIDAGLRDSGLALRALRVSLADSGESLHVRLIAARVLEEITGVADKGFTPIPVAFGYVERNDAGLNVGQKNVAGTARNAEARVGGEGSADMERIGMISTGEGLAVSYWRDKEGKIHEIPE